MYVYTDMQIFCFGLGLETEKFFYFPELLRVAAAAAAVATTAVEKSLFAFGDTMNAKF
jgi:hypothetical protein